MPSAKFDVDISSFKSGISSAKSEVRTLDQQMKMIDATFKATGNSEQALAQKTQTLNSRMTAQKAIADQAKQALDAMTQKGINPSSEAYQKMARELLAAQTGMMETQAALNDLSGGAIKAADSANQLEKGLNGISKKISLEQVISGIGKITDGLESAASKAKQLGESIWNEIMNSAQWADDTATMAQMYGIDLDSFQRMQKLVQNGLDTSVDAILNSQTKLKKGIGSGNAEVEKWLKNFGLMIPSGKDVNNMQMVTDDLSDLYFRLGQSIMGMSDVYEQESAAQALFGKSWKELVPLFSQYKTAEEFAAALEQVKGVISEEKMQAGTDLADKVGELESNLTSLKNNILLTMAPALNELATSLNTVLESILDYLDTPKGQAMLESLGDSISEMFSGLKDISAEDAVSAFESVFSSIVSGFEWISNNGNTLLDILKGIGAFWAGLKVSEGALTILKVIGGLKELTGLGAGATGLLSSGLGSALTGATKVTSSVLGNEALAANMPAVWDWFTHNTGIGQELFLGTKEKGSTWKEFKQNIEKNLQTFADDWKNNELVKFWTRRDMNQDAGTRLPQGENWLPSYMQDIQPKIEVIPEAPKDAALDLADQVGTVNVPVNLVVANGVGVFGGDEKAGGGNAIGRGFNYIKGHANGLPYVPFDNYLAFLHKGEQVVPAREITSRNFTSNLYVERMEMHNGQDAEGLAARIATAQRRTMNGYGS